jgi:hypothetical protein
MSPDLAGTDHTFTQLLEDMTPLPPGGATHIGRRIFTTRQNGRRLGSADDAAGSTFCGSGPACRVNLWPPDPNSVVQPETDYATAGILDARLFLKADGSQMTITDLMAAPLRACQGTNLPAGCPPLLRQYGWPPRKGSARDDPRVHGRRRAAPRKRRPRP